MQTDELIIQLSGGLRPVKRDFVARTLAIGVAGGIAGSMLLMIVTMGTRHDLTAAIAGRAFWMKLTYTLVIAGLGLWIVERSGRPGTEVTRPLALLALPVIAILALMAMQLVPADVDRHALIMGRSSNVCTVLIAMLSLPLFSGVFWALRRLAPTQLTRAGAAAGLLAGSTASSIYAFHCPESAAPFVAIWYTSGILLTTLLGAVIGRWTLRW